MRTYPHKLRTVVGFVGYLIVLCVAFVLISADIDRPVRAVSATLAFLAASGFCAAYHRRTRGHWRDTVHGVHLMTFSVALACMLLFLVLSLFSVLPMVLVPYLSAWIYLTLAFLFLWRWTILRDDQRRPANQPKDSDAAQ